MKKPYIASWIKNEYESSGYHWEAFSAGICSFIASFLANKYSDDKYSVLCVFSGIVAYVALYSSLVFFSRLCKRSRFYPSSAYRRYEICSIVNDTMLNRITELVKEVAQCSGECYETVQLQLCINEMEEMLAFLNDYVPSYLVSSELRFGRENKISPKTMMAIFDGMTIILDRAAYFTLSKEEVKDHNALLMELRSKYDVCSNQSANNPNGSFILDRIENHLSILSKQLEIIKKAIENPTINKS